MKRSTLALVGIAALAGGIAQPAFAGTSAKPVTGTFFFHSVNNGGTGNGNVNALAGGGTGTLPMDATKPTGTSDQEYGTFGAANNPNHKCVGNSLTMHPTWTGTAAGTLTNQVTVEFYARSTPGNATVQLFTDISDEVLCNAGFPSAVGEATVALPVSPSFGKVTAVLKLSKPVLVKSGFTIMITTEDVATPQASDIAFDSSASPSGVTFTCLPNKGKKTC